MNKLKFILAAGVLVFTSALSQAQQQTLFVDTSSTIYEYQGGVRSTFDSGLSGLGGMAFDSSGDLFVVSGNNSIIEFAYSGGSLSTSSTTVATGLKFPAGFSDNIAFDSFGNMFVSDSGSTSADKDTAKVYYFNYNSSTGGFNQSTLVSGNVYVGTTYEPTGQLVSSSGTLYLPNWETGGIEEFGLRSNGSTSLGPATNTILDFGSSTYDIEGLAVSSSGTLYASIDIGSGAGSIEKINSSTGAITAFASGAALNNTVSLGFDSNGDLYATANNSLLKFTDNAGTLGATPVVTSLTGAEDLAFEPIPEPSSLALAGFGAVAFIGWRRRRR